MKVYWYPAQYNIGDTLTPIILEHFLKVKIERVERNESGKLLAVGSIMRMAKQGDIVWGTGASVPKIIDGTGIKFLAVRGKLTQNLIKNAEVPDVYGDPALLMPLIYNPKIEKKHKIGVIPHYVDKEIVKNNWWLRENTHFIDVALPWKDFIDEVLSCEKIISSSLHGIIIAEAYGIPAEWSVYGDKIIGRGFKFQDYLTGTGRKKQDIGLFPPIQNLEKIQNDLIKALEEAVK